VLHVQETNFFLLCFTLKDGNGDASSFYIRRRGLQTIVQCQYRFAMLTPE
jgi:hypothetical protein